MGNEIDVFRKEVKLKVNDILSKWCNFKDPFAPSDDLVRLFTDEMPLICHKCGCQTYCPECEERKE